MQQQKCCLVIPTYNNAASLVAVIEASLPFTQDILVVNDGSTDETSAILEQIEGVNVIRHPVNQGKGMAIRSALKWANENKFQYIITIDSDGQHDPSDLPAFMQKLETNPDSIFLGSRDLSGETEISKGSSFANKFSNFWFRVETGLDMPDTQTGYRLYPVSKLVRVKWFTRKYEFEIEVIVRSAWKGIPILSVPIQVYYPPRDERVSHFRPGPDFLRISLLNTVLVPLALLIFRPLMLYRSLRKKNWRQIMRDEFYNPEESNIKKAISIGFGMFMGIFPIWGYQLAVCIPLAFAFRLNKVLVVLAAHISIPPMIPLILYISFVMGGWILGVDTPLKAFDFSMDFETIRSNMRQYVTGAIALATLAGSLAGIISYIILAVFRKNHPEQLNSSDL
ncbi:MAG: DUF2062 domain-containing protein [Bacteroidetes bacterium]|nr:DUF2062 domain-containing protein [Bacteroidota bacterium]